MKTFALATALFFVATIASAQIVQPCTDCGVSVWSEPDQTPAKCSADRPCGAEGSKLNAIIPQGWKGAEFKSACSSHDKCYGALGSDRAECDLQLKNDLVASCECSRRPRQCQRVAKFIYRGVDKFGEKAFDKGQQKAASRYHQRRF